MKTDDAQNELRICFIAYADILGYRERIKKCKNDYDALNVELKDFKSKILDPQNHLTESIEALQGTVAFFSDSVFVHVPILSETGKTFSDGRLEICVPIQDLGAYQCELAVNNIFIRGGATVNFGYIDSSIAFGPGIINAIECEGNAEFPRICLDDWALGPIKHYFENKWPGNEKIAKYILHGEDGKFFINYLYYVVDIIENECDFIPQEEKKYPLHRNVPYVITLLKTHKENIEKNITDIQDSKIRSKYIWLANYHNFFCRENFIDLESLIIPDYHEKFYSI